MCWLTFMLMYYVIGESTHESPQMCNIFTKCTVNITICENECKHKYWGSREMCATIAPAPTAGTHRMNLVQEAQEPNVMDLKGLKKPTRCKRFKCRCECLFKKKSNSRAPRKATWSWICTHGLISWRAVTKIMAIDRLFK